MNHFLSVVKVVQSLEGLTHVSEDVDFRVGAFLAKLFKKGLASGDPSKGESKKNNGENHKRSKRAKNVRCKM